MEQIAKAIGFLVYAVAKSDLKVMPEEKEVIHDFVNENWKVFADEEDPFGIRAMDYIDKMMVLLDKQEVKSEEAFDNFEKIFREYHDRFTIEIKEFALDLCIKVGGSFNQMNKSELVLLSRIEQLFKRGK